MFPIQEEELALRKPFATTRALRISENLENNQVFGPYCGCSVALVCLHSSTRYSPRPSTWPLIVTVRPFQETRLSVLARGHFLELSTAAMHLDSAVVILFLRTRACEHRTWPCGALRKPRVRVLESTFPITRRRVENPVRLCLAGLRFGWIDPIAEASQLADHSDTALLLRLFGDRWSPFFVTTCWCRISQIRRHCRWAMAPMVCACPRRGTMRR